MKTDTLSCIDFNIPANRDTVCAIIESIGLPDEFRYSSEEDHIQRLLSDNNRIKKLEMNVRHAAEYLAENNVPCRELEEKISKNVELVSNLQKEILSEKLLAVFVTHSGKKEKMTDYDRCRFPEKTGMLDAYMTRYFSKEDGVFKHWNRCRKDEAYKLFHQECKKMKETRGIDYWDIRNRIVTIAIEMQEQRKEYKDRYDNGEIVRNANHVLHYDAEQLTELNEQIAYRTKRVLSDIILKMPHTEKGAEIATAVWESFPELQEKFPAPADMFLDAYKAQGKIFRPVSDEFIEKCKTVLSNRNSETNDGGMEPEMDCPPLPGSIIISLDENDDSYKHKKEREEEFRLRSERHSHMVQIQMFIELARRMSEESDRITRKEVLSRYTRSEPTKERGRDKDGLGLDRW